MTQPVFPLTFFSISHSYPKGTSFQFGKGYVSNTAPQLPVQRTFRLHFNALQWFLGDDGLPDATINPTWNIFTLIQFYEQVRTFIPFTLNHPAYGPITVRFSADQTFEVPKSLDGGTGATDSLELFLVEQLT